MDLPKEIEEVLERIEKNGYEAYLVGGVVRDYLLGIPPSDYDITTNALPDEIEKIFSDVKMVDIGKKFGTILVIYKKREIEITTYRLDGKYVDGRRPDKVYFSDELGEDLKRRDFTINAMAYNPKDKLKDLFGGIEDLESGLIRTVGNPIKRFEEDYLRILRGIRFAAQLNFEIEFETFEAGKKLSSKLEKVSKERIRDELFKILTSNNPKYGIELLRKTGLLEIILPELDRTIGFDQNNPNHDKDIYYHTLEVVEKVPNKLELRLAALFHDLGKVETYSVDEEGIGHFYGHEEISKDLSIEILRRYNSPKVVIKRVASLVENHMIIYNGMKDRGKKRLISRMGERDVFDLLDLQIADRLGTREEKRNIDDLLNMKKELKDILSRKEVYEEKELAINGSHVIELGYKEGKKIGRILSFALDLVLEDPKLNDKDKLLKIILENFEIS